MPIDVLHPAAYAPLASQRPAIPMDELDTAAPGSRQHGQVVEYGWLPHSPAVRRSHRIAPNKKIVREALMKETLDSYVRGRAKALGLTQTELCRQARISRQTLHSLSGEHQQLPTLQTLLALAKALQVHPLRLLQLLCDDHPELVAAPRHHRPRGDQSAFVRDVTYPDGELVLPGQHFVKTWEVQNVGQVVWEDRYLQCMDDEIVVYTRSGEQLLLAQSLKPKVSRIAVPTTPPGQSVQLSVAFTAPALPCTVMSYWKSFFADGTPCLPQASGLWVKVVVTSLAASSSAFDRHEKNLIAPALGHLHATAHSPSPLLVGD